MLNPNTKIAPIFIVGSARAGTSALLTALRDAANIPADNEGHLVTMLHPLLKANREHFATVLADGTTVMRVGLEMAEDSILESVRRLQEYAFPNIPVWVDKTPDGPLLRAIPYIVRMWPNARFVFAKRRGIENVVSRMRKFPHMSFTENCERWAIAMNLWKERKATLRNGTWIEIEQREMSLQPEVTAKELCEFLGLNDSAADAVAYAFKTLRPESTGGNEKVVSAINTIGWSQSQIDIYRRTCSHVAKEWGYSEDENYYLR